MERRIRVLLVEDRDEYQKIFMRLIKPLGYELILASTVEESINALYRYSFHVAVVDLNLSFDDIYNRSGIRVLEHLNLVNEGTRAFVWTAYGTVDDARKAFRSYGVEDFISKDWMDLQEIRDTLVVTADAAQSEIRRRVIQRKDIIKLEEGDAISEFLAGLGPLPGLAEKERILKSFLNMLLSEAGPLLPDKYPATIQNLKNGGKCVTIRFWSKMLGKPIVACFGKRDEIKGLYESLSGKTLVELFDLGIGATERVLFNESVSSVFGGIVCELVGVNIDEFVPHAPS